MHIINFASALLLADKEMAGNLDGAVPRRRLMSQERDAIHTTSLEENEAELDDGHAASSSSDLLVTPGPATPSSSHGGAPTLLASTPPSTGPSNGGVAPNTILVTPELGLQLYRDATVAICEWQAWGDHMVQTNNHLQAQLALLQQRLAQVRGPCDRNGESH